MSRPTRGAIGLVIVYRRAIAPILAPRCRFYPSCSQYALEALRRYGLIRGLALAGARLGKCHPFHAGGVDPVPDRLKGRFSV